jgi:DNA-binding GntR family transcriptional regulator
MVLKILKLLFKQAGSISMKMKSPRVTKGSVSMKYGLERVRNGLISKPRDLLFFDLITQTGLKMQLILSLRAECFLGCKPGDVIRCSQPSHINMEAFVLNQTLADTWAAYYKKFLPSKDDYIVKSRKKGEAISLSSASHLVKLWFSGTKLEQIKGVTTLRRAWQANATDFRMHGTGKSIIKGSTTHFLPIASVSTVQERVYDSLLETIISGRIFPGERLVIEQVAKVLQVSIIPVREALQRLTAAGLVSIGDKPGISVTKLSVNDLEDITKIRLMLEGYATETAAKSCTVKSLKIIESWNDQWLQSWRLFSQKRDPALIDDILKFNRNFHLAIYEQSKIPLLQEIIEGLWNRVSPYLHILLRKLGKYDPADAVDFHNEIIYAIKGKNHRMAAKYLKKDLLSAKDGLIAILDHI